MLGVHRESSPCSDSGALDCRDQRHDTCTPVRRRRRCRREDRAVYWWLRSDLQVTEANPQPSISWSWDGTSILGDGFEMDLAEYSHNGHWTITHSSSWVSFTSTSATAQANAVYSNSDGFGITFNSTQTVFPDGTANCDSSNASGT